MKKIIIEGNKTLSGTIKIGGAKNSVVALIPASIMAKGKVKITNVPNISDKSSSFPSQSTFKGSSMETSDFVLLFLLKYINISFSIQRDA